jgi:Trypsin-like peptidase domain
VVELPGWQFFAMGTAVLIAKNLAITANHVLDAAIRKFGAKHAGTTVEIDGYSLRLYQVLPGPIYRVWNVTEAWACPSDIAILHLALEGSSESDEQVEWRVPRLRVVPPAPGQKVVAFGYRESVIEVTEQAGIHHLEFTDIGTISIGEVGQIFPERRDTSMLTFPCYEVLARFASGMSGGLVIDGEGLVCGLNCAGTNLADPNAPPLSYAVTLWPMLRTLISCDRGDRYPRGVEYPVIDLALDRIIHVVGLEQLDPRFFPGRSLTAESQVG